LDPGKKDLGLKKKPPPLFSDEGFFERAGHDSASEYGSD
jgi:hypothetical protein